MHTSLRDHLERMLRERRARLLRSASACETASQAFAEERESELEESAQEEQIDRVLGLLDDRQRREVVEINAALDRIADDTYGMCTRCERPIEIDRLAVMPETDVCLRCASMRETKQAAAAPTAVLRDPKGGALMKRSIIVMMATALFACSSPSLQPLAGPQSLVSDPGLVGTWAMEPPNQIRVVVTEGTDGRYLGALDVQSASPTTSMMLDLSLTQIGADRYVDLFLAKPEREALAGRYGFLALPVHQFMMLERDGDELRVTSFKAHWLRQAAATTNAFAMEVLPVAGHEIGVVTADSGSLNEFLRVHAHDPGATAPPMVFRRQPG